MPSCDEPELIRRSPKPINITREEQTLWDSAAQRGTAKCHSQKFRYLPAQQRKQNQCFSPSTKPISPHQPYSRESPSSVSAQCMMHTCPVVRITHTDMYSFTNVSKGAEERRGEPHHEQLPSTCSIKQTGALFVCLLAFLTKHQQVKKQALGNCI